jgi:hypothetical protein
LTDRETETLISSFQSLHEKLKSLSNRNLVKLAQEAERVKYQKYGNKACQHEGKTCFQNASRGFIKAFSVGYALKYGLELVPLLLTGRLFRRLSVLREIGGWDTTGFALFLGVFLGSYKALLCTLRRLRPHDTADGLNSFLAGCVAGLALLLERNKTRRLAIALYLSTRSMQFACVWLVKKWRELRQARSRGMIRVRSEIVQRKSMFILQEDEEAEETFSGSEQPSLKKADSMEDAVDKWLSKWAGTLVMGAASAQILFAYICAPWSLPRSYFGFLVTHGGLRSRYGALTVPLLSLLGDAVFRLHGQSGPDIMLPHNTTSAEFVSQSMSPNVASIYAAGIKHNYIGCAIEHPWNASCIQSHLVTWIHSYGRSLWLYAPLNAVMTLVFHGKKILTKPKETLIRYIKSTLRSAAFLASYVTMAWVIPCLLRNVLKREHASHYLINGFCSGLCAVIDAPSRRLELGMYCMPRALESFFRCGVEWGWWSKVKNGEMIYFSLAVGVLMHLYQCEADTIDDNYRGVMMRIFGRN